MYKLEEIDQTSCLSSSVIAYFILA